MSFRKKKKDIDAEGDQEATRAVGDVQSEEDIQLKRRHDEFYHGSAMTYSSIISHKAFLCPVPGYSEGQWAMLQSVHLSICLSVYRSHLLGSCHTAAIRPCRPCQLRYPTTAVLAADLQLLHGMLA